MSWQIQVPHRSRDEPLAAVADAARALSTDEDRAVVRQLVLGAARDGVATAGGLLDHIEKLGPAQRRSLLDQARVAAGLPATGQVDAQRDFEALQRTVPTPLSRERFQICAEPSCDASPMNPATLMPAPTDVKRWWCLVHEHLAPAGDMDPRPSGFRFGASGAIEQVGEPLELTGAGWESGP